MHFILGDINTQLIAKLLVAQIGTRHFDLNESGLVLKKQIDARILSSKAWNSFFVSHIAKD